MTGSRWFAIATSRQRAVWLGLFTAGMVITTALLVLNRTPPAILGADSVATPSMTPSPPATPSALPSLRPTASVTPVAPPATVTQALLPPVPITPQPGGQVIQVTPAAQAVGWIKQDDKAAHFGDYNIFAGVFDGQAHIGILQFDLSPVPRGAPILYADLTLTGLSDQFLSPGGQWTVRLLAPDMDLDWRQISFASLSRRDGVTVDLRPGLISQDLAAGRPNTFIFDSVPLTELNDRALRGAISFRIEGPASGANNVFSWDSGYGARSQNRGPSLRLVTGPAPDKPPATPTPHYVIITATPTPENILTVAAIAATTTAQATLEGTPTRLPPHWVTPIVLVPTETPANTATAEWYIEIATAQAFFGSPTPIPPNIWTATPRPSPSATPAPTQTRYILVTAAPTPANVVTAAAIARAATAQALRIGTPTPGPRQITIRVITNTPTPGNQATATWQGQIATAEAFVYGTPLPPAWVMTVTPVPPLQPITEGMIPTATAPPTPLPVTIPTYVRGKIAFLTDRFGGTPVVLVMDPDGSHVTRPTEAWVYQRALELDQFAPDNLQRVSVRNRAGGTDLWLTNTTDGWATRLLDHGDAFLYDPSWSPAGPLIAFVSNVSRNDEIYVVDKDTLRQQQLTHNEWAWDKHPSWSPDGSRIVFWSNREAGRKQIWVMQADGSQPQNLSSNAFNDWDPVWIK